MKIVFILFIVSVVINIAILLFSSKNRWLIRILLLLVFFCFPAFLSYYVGNERSCKSSQYEAKQSLGTIAKNQEAYMAEFGIYSDSCEKLKFAVKGNKRCYKYKIELGHDKKSYTATAWSKAPGLQCGGEGDDIWTINQNLSLKNLINVCDDYSKKSNIVKVSDKSCTDEDEKCSSCSDKYLPLLYSMRYLGYAILFIVICIISDLFINKPKSEKSDYNKTEKVISADNEIERL